MSRYQALHDRLAAIEAQLPVRPAHQAPPRPAVRPRHDSADRVSPVLQQLLAEVLPGALVLDWRQDGATHAGRMAAEGLLYRFRVDATGISYRPAWEAVGERGWQLRSDSFLQLRMPEARMDFRRSGATGQKRKCSTGYGCGSSCISLQKECRISPRTAIGKGRLKRLQELAAGGDATAASTAAKVQASRGTAALTLQKERNVQRVEKLLQRPEIAEFLRTGKLPTAANSSTEPGTVREMKPGEIAFDPSRFQYKINATSTTGEVGSLSGVRKWDANLSGVMSVWKDPADGKVYVVNGHNRLALANRLGAEAVTVRFLNAGTATEARAIGALQNIAEGAGTPMDAAKFFRDTGIKSQQDVEDRGLPLSSGQATKGLSLSRLPGDVFNAVVRGDLTVNRGAIIGGSGLNDAKQREVFKMIGARKKIADQTLQELVDHAKASEQRTQTTMSLFGETQEQKDNLITRAKLSASLKSKIGREKRLFTTVSKAKAASSLTEKGGNTINQEQSAKVADEASEALGVFERLKSSSGPISSALNRAADRVEAGESEAKVRKELEQDVFAAVEAELVAVGLRKPRKDSSLEARIDALKRKCQTGYGCGSACISLRKECRSAPGSAMGKERMKRLLALAGGGASSQRGIAPVRQKEAGELAAGISQRRGQQATQTRGARQQAAADPSNTTTTKKKGKVVVQIRRAKPGGEFGPDGHWYPGGAWISEGKFAGKAEQQPGLGAAASKGQEAGKSGGQEGTRVIRRKPPSEPPFQPSGLGVPEPKGLKTRAANNDADFFNDKGFIRWPRKKTDTGLGGTMFVAALAQRLTTDEMNQVIRRQGERLQGQAKEDFDYYLEEAKQSAATGGSSGYDWMKRTGALAGVDEARYVAANQFLEAIRSREESAARARKRKQFRESDDEYARPPRAPDNQFVWEVNVALRGIGRSRQARGQQPAAASSKPKEQGINAQEVTTSKQQGSAPKRLAFKLTYHGTSVEAAQAIREGGYKETKFGTYGAGVYTTTNKKAAREYAQWRSAGGKDRYGDPFPASTKGAAVLVHRVPKRKVSKGDPYTYENRQTVENGGARRLGKDVTQHQPYVVMGKGLADRSLVKQASTIRKRLRRDADSLQARLDALRARCC